MRYLLINHVPFGRGSSDGTYVVGDMWLEDLRAQARAINDAGMTLVVATPQAIAQQPLLVPAGTPTFPERAFRLTVPERRALSVAPVLRYGTVTIDGSSAATLARIAANIGERKSGASRNPNSARRVV